MATRTHTIALTGLIALGTLGGETAYAAWDIQTVHTGHELTRMSAGWDPSGRWALAYAGSDLFYATFDGSAWSIETVDEAAAFRPQASPSTAAASRSSPSSTAT